MISKWDKFKLGLGRYLWECSHEFYYSPLGQFIESLRKRVG